MTFTFQRVARPDPVVPDTTLDAELENAVDDASLTLYFVNMILVRASNLINKDFGGKSDPYCVATIGEISDRTEVIQNNVNPVWNETMSFFVPKKPDSISFNVFDDDSKRTGGGKDDLLGETKLEIGELFETGGSYEGELKLEKGSIFVNLKCRVMKPVETEVKLNFTQLQLEGKEKEQKATIHALDESEQLREDAIKELSAKDQEVIRKAEELEDKQRQHQTELSAKEKNILDQAQTIETKIQQYEEVQVALMEKEMQKKEAETKLTEAEEKILEKAKELERKELENADALTVKEKEILSMAGNLEVKEQAYEKTQKRIKQIEGLKAEIENELTSKENIILLQANELKRKEKEGIEALTSAEKKLIEKSKELEAKDIVAKAAQKKQDENEEELTRLRREHENAQYEVNYLKKLNKDLEEELKDAQTEIKGLTEKAAQFMSGCCGSGDSGCIVM